MRRTAIALTTQIGAAGGRGIMAIMVPVFFVFLCVVVVGCGQRERRRERRWSVVALSRIRKTPMYVGYSMKK